jgi:hypothetical protein
MSITYLQVKERDAVQSFTEQQVTLYCPLTGNIEYWNEYRRFLSGIEYPREKINLILLNTSTSEDFKNEIRHWLKESDFKNVRCINREFQKSVGSDDSNPVFEKQKRMCQVYNMMRHVVKTELLWIVEDTVIPPKHTLTRLLAEMTEETVSVSGVYPHINEHEKVCAWDVDNSLLTNGSGVTPVKGNGFGCVLLRMSTVREHVFTPDEEWSDIDRAFYLRLKDTGRIVLDWEVRCKLTSGSEHI